MKKPPEPGNPTVFVVRRNGIRVDRLVADELGCGRRLARALVLRGAVLVEGRRTTAGTMVRRGQRVEIGSIRTAPRVAPPPPLTVLWRGSGLLALSKPAGVSSVVGRQRGSVAERLATELPELCSIGRAGEAGLVHRLDRDTSGLLLVASEEACYRQLRSDFSKHRLIKWYLALVDGAVADSLHIDVSLARRRTRVVPARRRDRPLVAITEVEPLETTAAWSLVQTRMRTGVAHQIRAHLALAGHPLIGDLLYGGPPPPPGTRDGHLLHALRVRLPGRIDLAAPVADDFVAAYARLKKEKKG